MKNFARIGAIALAGLMIGCSSMSFNHDWDRDAGFQNYSTYAWMSQPTATTSTSAQRARTQNTLLEKRIHNSVDQVLREKGLTMTSDNPDLLLVYHTGLQDKVNVTDWGYRYSYDYWGWGGRDIDVYQYTEGTLIIDMIDANTKELVWRGSATGTVDPGASPEKTDAKIDKAVRGILESYPPKQR
jgi:hypothetical protein